MDGVSYSEWFLRFLAKFRGSAGDTAGRDRDPPGRLTTRTQWFQVFLDAFLKGDAQGESLAVQQQEARVDRPEERSAESETSAELKSAYGSGKAARQEQQQQQQHYRTRSAGEDS
jgi:hypothetical protein